MEPVRCHFSVIFENVVKFFWRLVPGVLIPLLATPSFSHKGLIIGLAVLVLFILALLWQFLAWRQTWLTAESEQLSIRSGLLWKKNKAIPYDKINTIDLSRNLFQRVVGTCRIKIDTGAVTGGDKKGAEVNLVFSLSRAEAIRASILDLTAGTQVASLSEGFADHPEAGPEIAGADGTRFTRPEYLPAADSTAQTDASGAGRRIPAVRARAMDFFLYGLTESKSVAIIGLLFGGMALAGDLLDEAAFEWLGEKIGVVWEQIARWQLAVVILLVLAGLLAIYLLANLVSIVFAIVRFYNFTASREGDNIHIEYGLLTAKSYTLPVKNIHAVVIGQNLLRQLLHQCSVEAVSIGYGDEKNEVALLIPLIRLDRLEATLGEILPEYRAELELQPAPRQALRRYFLVPALFLLLASVAAGLAWPPSLFALIFILPWLAVSRWLNYRNAGIAYTTDRLEVRSGGYIRKRYRVRMNAVQSVTASSHPFMEHAGLSNFRIDYHAPALRSIIRVKFLPDRHLGELRSLLETDDA